MLLIIDNYDSFTYNLVQYFGEMGVEMEVRRNDAVDLAGIHRLAPERICISPGPCTPDDAGISCAVIREFGPRVPVLGVCLGHQAIAEAFGGTVCRAQHLMHGKTSWICHREDTIFGGLENPFEATRYHSLIVQAGDLPECLLVNAWTEDETIMGLRHLELPVFGVQFHPESIMTREGKKLLENFLCWEA